MLAHRRRSLKGVFGSCLQALVGLPQVKGSCSLTQCTTPVAEAHCPVAQQLRVSSPVATSHDSGTAPAAGRPLPPRAAARPRWPPRTAPPPGPPAPGRGRGRRAPGPPAQRGRPPAPPRVSRPMSFERQVSPHNVYRLFMDIPYCLQTRSLQSLSSTGCMMWMRESQEMQRSTCWRARCSRLS